MKVPAFHSTVPSDLDVYHDNESCILAARIVTQRSAADPNLHYVDGCDLYGAAENEELPLPDQLHPDAATHRLIGERFARRVFADDGAFARTV